MTRRSVRLVLLLALVGGLAAATALIVSGHASAASARRTWEHFDRLAAHLLAGVGDLHSAQAACVAPGQDPAWWHQRVVSGLASARSDIDRLRARAHDPDALNDLDAAAASLEAFADLDARAGRLLTDDRIREAASLIYGESLAAVLEATRRIDAAREAERQAHAATSRNARQREIAAAGGAALLALVVAALLAPRTPDAGASHHDARMQPARQPVAAMEASSFARTMDPTALDAALELSSTADAAAVDAPAGGSATQVEPRAPGTGPAPVADPEPAALDAPATSARDRRRAPELRATADLCTDFARLIDGQELPALLERSAQVLDATGLIVWVAEPGADELRPLLAHGYSAAALARLPAIPRDADNATAAAFRLGQLEIVKTNGMSPGAIAAPLLAPQGCIGVMAAEVRHGREASESARALARIVAAQLATLVSFVPPHEQTPSEAHTAVG